MILGAASQLGTIDLGFSTYKMNSKDYNKVLNEKLLLFLKKYKRHRPVFQQDNAIIHKSEETVTWLEAKKVSILPWPSHSPDCNPIENIWGS